MRTLIGVAIVGVLAAGCGQAETKGPPAPAEPPPLPTQAPDLKGDPAPPAVAAAAPRSAEGYPVGDQAIRICKAALMASHGRSPDGATLQDVQRNMVTLSWPDPYGVPIKFQCRVRTGQVDIGSVDRDGPGSGVRWKSDQITYTLSDTGAVTAEARLNGKLLAAKTYTGP